MATLTETRTLTQIERQLLNLCAFERMTRTSCPAYQSKAFRDTEGFISRTNLVWFSNGVWSGRAITIDCNLPEAEGIRSKEVEPGNLAFVLDLLGMTTDLDCK